MAIRFISSTLILLTCLAGYAQIESSATSNPYEGEIFDNHLMDEQASYKGGHDDLIQFILDHLDYPEYARSNKVEGTVVIEFVVNPKGELDSFKILTREHGYGLEEEVIRVVNLTSGKWKPAVLDGYVVAVRYRVPVKFKL